MLKRFFEYHFRGANLLLVGFLLLLIGLGLFWTATQQRGDGNGWILVIGAFIFLFHLACSFLSWWKGGRR